VLKRVGWWLLVAAAGVLIFAVAVWVASIVAVPGS
jgi:uncharacterized membrane protein